MCVLGQPKPVGSVLTFPSGYDTLEYSWMKATAVFVRLRILFVTLQNTNSHIDGAFAGDHLLPVSEHGPDWRAADLLCHGVHVLQLGQAAEAKVCMSVHNHGEPLG